jgi:hypothetical protein
MSISALVGYVAILIALGFAITATFSAADERGLLDRRKRSQAAHMRHLRGLHARR